MESRTGSVNGDAEPTIYTNADICITHRLDYFRIQRGITHLSKEVILIMGHKKLYEDSRLGDDIILYDGLSDIRANGNFDISKMNGTNQKLDVCTKPISVYCKIAENQYIFMGIFRRTGKAIFSTKYTTDPKGVHVPTYTKWIFPIQRIL
jgi:hypothetical protein